MRQLLCLLWACCAGLSCAVGQEEDKKMKVETSVEAGASALGFFTKGLYPGQHPFYPSFSLQPSVTLNWTDNNGSITTTGFGRYDPNGNSRTHWDIREMYYQTYTGNWEFNVGIKKFFWGTLETIHPVNVINQVDLLEGLDGEEKLGQPVVEVIYSSSFGDFSFMGLPYSRELDFGNEAGRPRTPEVIADRQVTYAADLEQWHPTMAMRWAHYIGNMDLGLHYFYGNAREPLILFDQNGLVLEYPVVHQVGLDAQLIVNSVLFKLESIYRAGDFHGMDNIFVCGGGVEYTFGNVNKKGLDIGVLAEYIYDNRRELTFSSLDNDVFVGSRITLNNEASTEVIVGVFNDLSKSSIMGRLEASQRVASNIKVLVNAQFFNNINSREFAYFFREDSNVELAVIKYF